VEDTEKQYKILIVDDDNFLVSMYAAKFGSNGVFVEVCKSGDSLLEKLSAGIKVDLILLDIVMPNMDGIEALKKMREQKLGEGIPVVIFTNQSDEKKISEAQKLGISGYIVKSAAAPSEVVNEVINIIKNSRV
jgi:CheY-like chemotaxis protein